MAAAALLSATQVTLVAGIRHRSVGCQTQVALLTPQELRQRFSWINSDDICAASLGLKGEGWFDGYMFTRAVRAMAIAQGASFEASRVKSLVHAQCKVNTVLTEDGQTIQAKAFINAAGPWARAIAAMAGIELPVFARRRTVFAMRCASDDLAEESHLVCIGLKRRLQRWLSCAHQDRRIC
jgi:FAD-dependent oxidoreductase domain-containing protein 1